MNKNILITIVAIFSFALSSFAFSLQKLTVVLDWFVNPNHAPLFVAKQQGYYKQLGLDVNFIAPADPSDPPKWVAVGKADLAIDYQPQYLMEVANGLPLLQVGTLVDQPLSCFVVLQNSTIKTIADLKGKRIGYSNGGANDAVLQTMLAKNGLTLQQVQLINVHYSLLQALLSKKIDAASGMMRNFEVIQMQLMGQPARAFYPEQNGVPSYDELIFVANRKSANDPKIKAFLQATAMGVSYLRQHPNIAWQQFAKDHAELNNALNQRAWFTTLPTFAGNPAVVDSKQCHNLASYLQKSMKINIPKQVCGVGKFQS